MAGRKQAGTTHPPAPPRARPPRVSSPRRRQQVFSPALGAHTGLRLREEPGVPHKVWGGQQGRLHRLGSLLGLSCTVPDGVSVRQASLGPQGLQGGLSAAQWMPVFDMEIWAVRMDAAQREVYAKRQLLKKEALRLGKERGGVHPGSPLPAPAAPHTRLSQTAGTEALAGGPPERNPP